MDKTVAIVQARVGSSRLPGKTLMQLGDRSVLARVLLRLSQCKSVDQIVVATTTEANDDRICREATDCNAACFRGSEDDVLARYHGAAIESSADHVVRVTSDCPLIDPSLIDAMLADYLENKSQIDYLSNANPRSFAHGLDTEIFSSSALAIANREASLPAHREHVTPYLYTNPDRFQTRNYRQDADHTHHRWTLDEVDDLRFFQSVVARLPDPLVTTQQVLDLLHQEPELAKINCHVRQKSITEAASGTSVKSKSSRAA